MIYCSVKYCCSNSSIPGVILHSIMKSIKSPNHPAYHWSTLWPLEVWVRGLYNSWWFCVHKLIMFIYLSMVEPHVQIQTRSMLKHLSAYITEGLVSKFMSSDVRFQIIVRLKSFITFFIFFTCKTYDRMTQKVTAGC